eukprot:TRINITY_DN8653_c0_g1_i3.p5 TRINITY_DN8653_c0_g1~~TRINITY_DN8653_c0_g1_i3.p5  ORF type:complete len:247 (-),score=1.72 TRINITY_DN8653_c0_g1_i3:1014-1754(-)
MALASLRLGSRLVPTLLSEVASEAAILGGGSVLRSSWYGASSARPALRNFIHTSPASRNLVSILTEELSHEEQSSTSDPESGHALKNVFEGWSLKESPLQSAMTLTCTGPQGEAISVDVMPTCHTILLTSRGVALKRIVESHQTYWQPVSIYLSQNSQFIRYVQYFVQRVLFGSITGYVGSVACYWTVYCTYPLKIVERNKQINMANKVAFFAAVVFCEFLDICVVNYIVLCHTKKIIPKSGRGIN